jgi:hypothetical protein
MRRCITSTDFPCSEPRCDHESQMKHTSRPQSVSWFQDHYKAGRLTLRPPFQRKPVWTEKQRSSLIESILLEIPVPEIYIQVSQDEDGVEEYGVVDGQQRLRTILQFIGIENEDDQQANEDNNSFSLETLKAASPWKDKSFADVTGENRKKFFQYEICVRMLYTENITEVEDVFKRLNKFTMPLKAQELRNATYHGAFARLAEKLADKEYWAVNRIITPASIRRMGDIEMMSDLLIGLIHGPQGGSAKIIDQYYEQYEQYDDEIPGQAKLASLFDRTLRIIETVFPNLSEVPRWGNRADFYSLFQAFGSQLTTHDIKNTKKALAKALTDFAESVDASLEDATVGTPRVKRYARAIEKGSNDKARRTDRHEVLIKVLEPFLRGK